jgi:hypothetical protein
LPTSRLVAQRACQRFPAFISMRTMQA